MSAARLSSFLEAHETIFVLTGAGCSTASGIPAYRDDAGNWRHRQPVFFTDFAASENVRRRYWARSFAGWPRIAGAVPNDAHLALAALENAGRVNCLATQNVDGLHHAAGSRNVIDLHGLLERVCCLDCDRVSPRSHFQARLAEANPAWAALRSAAPDGDADIPDEAASAFVVPDCEACGGRLKPDVVFFGEAVPPARVRRAGACLERADAMLVVGSSLAVYSGFRFARMARARGMPLAVLNRGVTRADRLATCRLNGDCEKVLPDALSGLGAAASSS